MDVVMVVTAGKYAEPAVNGAGLHLMADMEIGSHAALIMIVARVTIFPAVQVAVLPVAAAAECWKELQSPWLDYSSSKAVLPRANRFLI